MTTLNISFHEKDNSPAPYICGQQPIEFIFNGKEGSIYFDGYYYVEDHAPPYPEDNVNRHRRYNEWLPKKAIMIISQCQNEPYEVVNEGPANISYYRSDTQGIYIVEIYRRVLEENTNQYSELDEFDGMSVCFFPTNKQTIYFKVIEVIS